MKGVFCLLLAMSVASINFSSFNFDEDVATTGPTIAIITTTQPTTSTTQLKTTSTTGKTSTTVSIVETTTLEATTSEETTTTSNETTTTSNETTTENGSSEQCDSVLLARIHNLLIKLEKLVNQTVVQSTTPTTTSTTEPSTTEPTTTTTAIDTTKNTFEVAEDEFDDFPSLPTLFVTDDQNDKKNENPFVR